MCRDPAESSSACSQEEADADRSIGVWADVAQGLDRGRRFLHRIDFRCPGGAAGELFRFGEVRAGPLKAVHDDRLGGSTVHDAKSSIYTGFLAPIHLSGSR
ncbi:hypothetical protein NDU88_000560 [Pleurodeles waltl]|uniref:Uncharacterized protein n=1 Tax=Pleurodeles waltl TaxID=8319 RepID=A0AAV7TFF6_PLEWA|nr:hypothetical protein NDU88_000560 [Pleurodeles waltl]